jgi:dienelactone hydrolase
MIIVLLAPGCASVRDRYEAADRIAAEQGFEKTFIKTGNFTLTAYRRFTTPLADVNVYIEGDGSAWLSRTQLSDDPTPRRPLVLELAAMDPAPNVAYLARPGQYTAIAEPGCHPDYWSDRRFSQEVVAAVNQAIDRLLRQTRSDRVCLIGYSGGAALAVLIAACRNDVATLRTVAGNLDTEAVNRHHGVSTLSGSLNPIDAAEKLKNLPQHHFAGSKDTVVPPFIIESFLKRAGDQDGRRFTIVDGVSHTQGWSEIWKSLLTVPF